MCGHYFVQYGFIQICILNLFFRKTSFFLLYACFCVFFLFYVEFDVIFINFITFTENLCFYSHFLETICKNRYRLIKIWVHLLIKRHDSRELSSFWNLKIRFIKKNVKHSQIETYQQEEAVEVLFWTFRIIVEMTDMKCRLFSKHLFTTTQQHGSCIKPLGNDKFE